MLEKKVFRKQQLSKLVAQKEVTQEAGQLLLAKLLQTSAWKEARSIGVTLATEIEVPTETLIQKAYAEGKKVAFPRTLPKRQMVFLEAPATTDLERSSFGVLEPKYVPERIISKPDLLIVPGIAFALDSHYRVGFGGGYYDRYLKDFPGKKVALVAPAMAYPTATWQVESFDISLDQLITL